MARTFCQLFVKWKWVNHASLCVCIWVSVNQRNPVGFILAVCEIKLFELLSLFNSSHCGRVDEKWEIDWGCVKLLKVSPHLVVGITLCWRREDIYPVGTWIHTSQSSQTTTPSLLAALIGGVRIVPANYNMLSSGVCWLNVYSTIRRHWLSFSGFEFMISQWVFFFDRIVLALMGGHGDGGS